MTATERLSQFLGYGRLDARLCFIGFEEGVGTRPQRAGWTLRWEVEQRANWSEVIDAHDAHQSLLDRYWKRGGRISAVWRYAAKIARGMDGADDWEDAELSKAYAIHQLGRTNGNTLLCEVMPLPRRNRRTWTHECELLYGAEQAYFDDVEPRRLQALRERVVQHESRQLICCYGEGTQRAQWAKYKTLFPETTWRPLAQGRIERATLGGTLIYLLPFFGNGRIGNAQIRSLVEDARAHAQ